MPKRTIRIIQMEKHFLYLPIYYAIQEKFFGFLPSDIEVVIDDPVAERTDVACYDQMMSDMKIYKDSVIAITDPIQILRTNIKDRKLPAVLAAIATNGAFWAVNHGTLKRGGLRALGFFDRIITFDKGTTSYNIAARIAHDSGKNIPLDQFIKVVSPGNELLLLSDPNIDSNTVALSPNILEIVELIKNNPQFSIELPIGSTPEYNDVLVAALVSNNEFVSGNLEIISGILRGLQKSLKLIHDLNDDVIQFCHNYFRNSENAREALTRAIEANVVPFNVKIAQSHWMSAAKANKVAEDQNLNWSVSDENNALEYFEKCIKPYEKIRSGALIEEMPPFTEESKKKNILLQFAISFLSIALTGIFGWQPALILTLGLFIAWALTFLVQKANLSHKIAVRALFIIALLICALPFISFLNLKEKQDIFLPLGIGFMPGIFFEWYNHVRKKHTI